MKYLIIFLAGVATPICGLYIWMFISAAKELTHTLAGRKSLIIKATHYDPQS